MAVKITGADRGTPAEQAGLAGATLLSIDGNDVAAVAAALEVARTVKGRPTALVCHTVKGKGVSFMENQVQWHGVAPSGEQMAQAMEELGAQLRELEVE